MGAERAHWNPFGPIRIHSDGRRTSGRLRAQLSKAPLTYLSDEGQLTVHIEWVDSLLLFSHLYNNYDALATLQRHQLR